MNCHQGRESMVSVNELVEGLDEDAGNEKLRFLNIHYFAAGATLFGTEAKGAYEYEGKTYVGRNEHVEEAQNCTQCHNTHGLEVRVELCADCHGVESEEDLRTIRESGDDFDGDGDTDEGLAAEIDTMREALYAALQDNAQNEVGTAIVYDQQSHPYFFIDTNGNGEADPDEANSDNRYNAWTPRLLKAAYNYQYSTKDPGAFAHNGLYIIQVLYDSLEDLGADVSTMTRP
jgi:mono/diheme cytochrome c family protein